MSTWTSDSTTGFVRHLLTDEHSEVQAMVTELAADRFDVWRRGRNDNLPEYFDSLDAAKRHGELS